MDKQERAAELLRVATTVERAPSLRRVNGIGTTIVGTFRHPDLGNLFIGAHWFTFFFIPLLRNSLYVMADGPGGTYRFVATISSQDFAKIFPDGPGVLATSAWKDTAVSIGVFVTTIAVVACMFAAIRQLGRH